MQVLDKGILELRDMMGGDLAVVEAARVSNGVVEDYSKGVEGDGKLINYLMKHRHGTPFEHSVFKFYVKCPLFVAREWQRHRISSFNEISGRYVEFQPEFYYPELFRVPAATNKQGSTVPEKTAKNYEKWLSWQSDASRNFRRSTEQSWERYKFLLNHGVAKEMARMILPLNLYTEYYYTANARSLMNFMSLRRAENAQLEIRQYANAIIDIFAGTMPLTYQAWKGNDFLAP